MLKTIIVAGLAGFLGYQLGSFTGERRISPPAEAATGAPAARIARDVRRMCRDLDPLLSEFESAYADERLSANDMYRLAQRAEELF